MATLKINLDDCEVKRILGGVAEELTDKGKLSQVVVRALNAAITTGKAEAKRQITARYAVPAKQVDSTMSVRKAYRQHLNAQLTLKGRMAVELVHYGAKASRSGVRVRVLKHSKPSAVRPGGEQRILATKKRGVSATWLAKGHVLARTAGHDHPLMLWGPSFLSVMNNDETWNTLNSVVQRRFTKQLQFFANSMLEKLAGKGK